MSPVPDVVVYSLHRLPVAEILARIEAVVRTTTIIRTSEHRAGGISFGPPAARLLSDGDESVMALVDIPFDLDVPAAGLAYDAVSVTARFGVAVSVLDVAPRGGSTHFGIDDLFRVGDRADRLEVRHPLPPPGVHIRATGTEMTWTIGNAPVPTDGHRLFAVVALPPGATNVGVELTADIRMADGRGRVDVLPHRQTITALVAVLGAPDEEFGLDATPMHRPTHGRPMAPARWINAEMEDVPRTEPLPVDRTSTLAVAVAIDVDERAALAAALLQDADLFPKGVEEVTLTIQLDTDDFDVEEPTRPLRLPRTGSSRGKARFDITPRREGRCSLVATVHFRGNFVQRLDIAVSVGGERALPVAVTSTGRPLSSVAALQPRDLLLNIEPKPGSGFTCTAFVGSRGYMKAEIPITEIDLADAVDTAREELMAVITSEGDTGDPVFQTALDIPPERRAAALRRLALAGAALFARVFYPDDGKTELKQLGDSVREIACQPGARLRLQFVSKQFTLPWGLLYVGDVKSGFEPSWDYFLGFRHLIEQLPLMVDFVAQTTQIASDQPSLVVSTTVNGAIDAEMQFDVVAGHQAFWEETAGTRAGLRVVRRDGAKEVLAALADVHDEAQFLYFYCHATAPALGTDRRIGAAALTLADGQITLTDLWLEAPSREKLNGRPVVFINACGTQQLSPLFYQGFVPYFIAKGARGVIGTECKVPALFAAEWGRDFFTLFLEGQTLAETLLALRRAFLDKYGNPLGLVYGIHGDGDVRIEPALGLDVLAP